ncbi:hypothetical protein ACOI1A_00785 [Corynebacterium glutamicum]|uniref:hypothetical protein n=1 Tax=Corynebacterium glutamicum TaxID=1718 RepID=UPI003B5A78E2
MSDGLTLGFQIIPSTYEEIASQEKARRLLVENLVGEIARLTVENEELKLAMRKGRKRNGPYPAY